MQLTNLLVVKRPFKSYGIMYERGVILDDSACIQRIKRFKTKVREGKLLAIPTDPQLLLELQDYFYARYGINFKASMADYIAEHAPKEEELPKVEEPPKAPKKNKAAAKVVKAAGK